MPSRPFALFTSDCARPFARGAIVGALLTSFALSLSACGPRDAAGSRAADVEVVERTTFDMNLPVSGELAAMKQIEIRNTLPVRAVITEIIPEGKWVERGEILLRLAEKDILDKVKDAEERLNVAMKDDLRVAEATLTIAIDQRKSDLDKADVSIETARLALLAWQNGEFVSREQALKGAYEAADINAKRLDDRVIQSKQLMEKEFISKDEYERDRIAQVEARVKLQQAEIDLKVFREYTAAQESKKRESDYEQAVADRNRIDTRTQAEVDKAKTAVESAQFKVNSARERLEDLKLQLAACTVAAPSSGLVVYATSLDSGGGGRGGGDAQTPQVGVELAPNELVIILPDTSQMVASLKVSEALSGRIRAGQAVTVYSDALPNVPVSGTVQSVSVLAASGGWRDPNRRDYTVRVALHADPSLGLKPSMRCKAEILLDRVHDALSVPLQALFRQGPFAYAYVEQGSGYAQRLVTPGRASELRIEILDGLEAGDRILLREPSADEVVAKLDFETLQQNLPRQERGPGRPDRESPGEGVAQNHEKREKPAKPDDSAASSQPREVAEAPSSSASNTTATAHEPASQ